MSITMQVMPLLVVGLITVAGALLGYRSLRRMQHIRKQYDVGAVSEEWLQKQRGKMDNQY